jgi:peptide deformylase
LIEVRGMVRIRTLGDPVLKERARPVESFDEKLGRLAAVMVETMDREEGVGLAATQVGVLSRIIVWRDPDEDDGPHAFVNPLITWQSEACTAAAEGCLSLPGMSLQVSRPDEVTVSADDLTGQRLEAYLSGYPARIVQHEIDHLDGYLILDRATPEERRRVMKELRDRNVAADS